MKIESVFPAVILIAFAMDCFAGNDTTSFTNSTITAEETAVSLETSTQILMDEQAATEIPNQTLMGTSDKKILTSTGIDFEMPTPGDIKRSATSSLFPTDVYTTESAIGLHTSDGLTTGSTMLSSNTVNTSTAGRTSNVSPTDTSQSTTSNAITEAKTTTFAETTNFQTETTEHTISAKTTEVLTTESAINACMEKHIFFDDGTGVDTLLKFDAHSRYGENCDLFVEVQNYTALSLKLLRAAESNTYPYFYVEILSDHSMQKCLQNDNVMEITLSVSPCLINLYGRKFHLNIQNVDLVFEMDTIADHREDCSSIDAFSSRSTDPEGCEQVHYQGLVNFTYGKWGYYLDQWYPDWNLQKLDFDCKKSCKCVLGLRKLQVTCINSSDTTRFLIVYEYNTDAVRFDATGLDILDNNAFNGLSKLASLVLSHNNIKAFPPAICHDLPILKLLVLNHNKLVNISNDVFVGACSKALTYIDLSYNELESLVGNLFKHVTSLVQIILYSNRLTQLPADIFEFQQQLDIINVGGNALTTLPEGIFKNQRHLFKIILSDNNISSLPLDIFAPPPYIEILDLSNNSFYSLPEHLFADQLFLYDINLSRNALTILPQNTFESQREFMSYLDLSYNDLVSLPAEIFVGMERVEFIDLRHNNLQVLPQGLLHSAFSLRVFDVSNNNISTLQENLFPKHNWFSTIDLSNNNLITFPADSFIFQYPYDYLKYLDISSNSLQIIQPGSFNIDTLVFLNLSNNAMREFPKDLFSWLTKLSTLDISQNELANISKEAFTNMVELIYINMSHNAINILPSFAKQNYLEVLDVGNNKIRNISEAFTGLNNLQYLGIKKNAIIEMEPISFVDLQNLVFLDLSYNSIAELVERQFENLNKLNTLILSNNLITIFHDNSFRGLYVLEFLDLSFNQFYNLDFEISLDLYNLDSLNVSHNSIRSINFLMLWNETQLRNIDLRSNNLYLVTDKSFMSLNSTILLVDHFSTCCFVGTAQCVPENSRPEYLTCSRMFDSGLLRISIWTLGLFAVVCNGLAFCIKIRERKSGKVQTMLILQLTMSDFLMGLNMMILAIADTYYANYFPSYAGSWRTGIACKVAGILSILSSEGSVFFITLISIDRMLGVVYPFSSRRMNLKKAKISALVVWLVSLTVSLLPTILVNFGFDNMLDTSEVCVGIPIVKRQVTKLEKSSVDIGTTSFVLEAVPFILSNFLFDNYPTEFEIIQYSSVDTIEYEYSINSGSQIASIYSIIVFIGINLVCFLIVMICYAKIFLTARATARRASRTQNLDNEIRMAQRMFGLIFTDFCCWVPLCLVCILSQCGLVEVSPDVYAWTVAFVLPINSSINPFLYTLAGYITDRVTGDKKETMRGTSTPINRRTK